MKNVDRHWIYIGGGPDGEDQKEPAYPGNSGQRGDLAGNVGRKDEGGRMKDD